jgi:hypothetical protein
MKPNKELLDFILNVDLSEFIDIVSQDKKMQLELIRMQDRLHIGSNTHDPSIIKSLNKIELKKAIQIFTLMDRLESRGSVSCVSQLLGSYKNLSEIDKAEFDALLDWVLKTNDDKNPWLATGSAVFGVRSLVELEQYQSNNASNKMAKNILSEALMAKQQQDKKEKLRLKANQDIWNAIRRKDKKAIEVHIIRGADLEQINENGESVKSLLEKIL